MREVQKVRLGEIKEMEKLQSEIVKESKDKELKKKK
jgi:hypothetical protein